MPITDPLVLAADVEITPVSRLSARTRLRLGARRGEYAITRTRGREPAKLVSRTGAMLLQEFRKTRLVVQAVHRVAERTGAPPDRLLEDGFPLLRDCFNGRFLVPAGSPESARLLPTLERGDAAGEYVILRCLHLLDDTELYQVRDARGRAAALKLLRPAAGRRPSATLAREAAVLEHLAGAGAPRLLARGRQGRRGWIAMQWCAGVAPPAAFAELRDGGAAARPALLRLAVRIASAYARLHAAGVLHGDVHPGNLLIGRRGDVTLVDFGLARPLAGRRLAGAAGRGGVVHFFAPEQAAALLAGRGLPLPTVQSEQYAVAAVLYRLVTGSHHADFPPERRGTLEQIVRAAPRPFSRAGAAPWPVLEDVLARALAKPPGDRYPDMKSFERALRRAARSGSVAATSFGGAADARLSGSPVLWRREATDRFVRLAAEAAAAGESAVAPPTCSLFLGRTGTAQALLRIACVRDDPAILALADVWLTWAERDAGMPDAFTAPGPYLTVETLGSVSPFHSSAGVHFSRAAMALALGDERGAVAAAHRFAAASRPPRGDLDLLTGHAGTLLAATRLLELMPARHAGVHAAVRTLGNDALAALWLALDSLGPAGQPDACDNSGIAHGWAGMLYASLGWCAVTGAALPRGLTRRLGELARAAEPLGRGVRWAQPDASAAPGVAAAHDVAGWCNGPAGFVHLWLRAHERLGRASHLALAESCAWSTAEAQSGAADLCCGAVGRAYALLHFYRYTGQTEWLRRAEALARLAEERFAARGDALERPFSLFKGLAGLAVLAADLDQPERSALPLFEPDLPMAATDA